MKIKLVIYIMFLYACEGKLAFSIDGYTISNSISITISTNQAAVIEQKLKDYEAGKLSLEDLGENASENQWQQLIGYYLSHTNDISVKAKLPIARSFAHFHQISQATKLGEDYVEVYSNDWRGWRLLGFCYDVVNNADKALLAYSNSVKFGNTAGYEQLGGCAVRNNRWDIIKNIEPQLLDLKNAKETSEKSKLSLLSILTAYADCDNHKDVFIEALKGEDIIKIIQADKVIKTNIITGCEKFEGPDIDSIHQKLKSAANN